MKKLLILGSDFGTISVVREAHKMGLYVIVADLMETSPTKEEADEEIEGIRKEARVTAGLEENDPEEDLQEEEESVELE